jgi:hypothetical protein
MRDVSSLEQKHYGMSDSFSNRSEIPAVKPLDVTPEALNIEEGTVNPPTTSSIVSPALESIPTNTGLAIL